MMSWLPRVDPSVRVLFVAPPRFYFRRRSPVGTGRDGIDPIAVRPGLQAVDERLWVVQPALPLPNRTLRTLSRATVSKITVRATRRAIRTLAIRRPILWAYGPAVEPIVRAVQPAGLCYDVVDDYLSLPNYGRNRDRLEAAEHRLLTAADVVLTTTQSLADRCARLNSNCHVLGNAADVDAFAVSSEMRPPVDLARLPRPWIGFHGALTEYKLDLDLINSVARQRPDWTFVFVGPVREPAVRRALTDCENIVFLGLRSRELIPRYVGNFDACIIPYRKSAYTSEVNPLKAYEILAAGRPLVATRLASLEPLDGVVRLADGPAEFVRELDKALAENGAGVARRRLAARPYSWRAKTERAWEVVLETIERGPQDAR
jgi:glycosyltransferase involved in cell wall biosynthesis